MKQSKKNQKGFTLIELIIVIAIMGILAAVLVPSFSKMTAKARVSTDLRSVQALQRQLDLYATEHKGVYPTAVATAVSALIDGQYIDAKATTGSDAVKVGLQSGATLVLSPESTGSTKYLFKLGKTAKDGKTVTDKILDQLVSSAAEDANLIDLSQPTT